jgi:GntP family gluconate:H+ symporter
MITPLLAFAVGPIGILILSVTLIVILIAVFRLNAFFALILAAAFVSLMIAAGQTGDRRFEKAVESVMTEAGVTMSRVGFSIAMAAVIGMCLMESGAADKVIRRTIAVVGEGRAALALLACGFILSAPVFVDTVIMLLLPLARALSLRTGKNYLLYALVIGGGGMISNGVVPPAPGPLFVAETLKLDVGITILAGVLFGLPLLVAALFLAGWFNRRMPVPVRATPGSSLESLEAMAARPESELPGFWVSIAPVLAPMFLITTSSVLGLLHARLPPGLAQWLAFLGNKNVALFIGGAIALAVHARQKKIGWRSAGKVLGAPLETAGVIILVISAGGAYGAMIQKAGVAEAARHLAGNHSPNYVLLAWTIAAIVRAAQGSATVATITAAGIMVSIAGPAGFGVHPIYILLAIGFGSKFLSWMNDAGFWVISRLGGLTQAETLGSWTILASIVSVLGLAEVLLVSHWFPAFSFCVEAQLR